MSLISVQSSLGDGVCPLNPPANESCSSSLQDEAAAANSTECLYKAASMWGPSAYLWLLAPFYIIYLLSRGKDQIKPGPVGKIKLCTTIVLAMMTSYQATRRDLDCESLTNGQAQMYMDWTQVGTFLLAALVIKLEGSRRGSSFFLALFWSLAIASSAPIMYYNIAEETYLKDFGSFVMSLLSLLVVWVQLILSLVSDRSAKATHEHPENAASFLSRLTLDWFFPLVWKGYNEKLEEDDIPNVNTQDMCQTLYAPFQNNWNASKRVCEEINRKTTAAIPKRQSVDDHASNNKVEGKGSSEAKEPKEQVSKQPSLFLTLLKTYGLKYILIQIFKTIVELGHFVWPLMLEIFIKFIQNRANEPWWKGYAVVIAMCVYSIVFDSTNVRSWAFLHRFIDNIKMPLKMAVFQKSLTVSSENNKEKTTGELVSLISEDVEKVMNAARIAFFIVATPLQICLAIYFLYHQLGTIATCIGVAILLSLIPINSWVGKKLKSLEKNKNDIKDERVKVMNEILSGIKVLKLYAWEESFLKKVCKIRDDEVSVNKHIKACHSGIDMMFRAIPFLVRLAGYIIFTYLGGYLDPAKAFITAELFNKLNEPFSRMAVIIPEFVQASLSMKRLNEFLNKSDIPSDAVVHNDSESTDASVSITDGTFTWDSTVEKPGLDDINLQIPKGGLVAVVGTVGSGKSSLLSAILGEMTKLKGRVTAERKVAFVPQEAWVQNASLRDNILFGSDYEAKRYNEVVNGCALKDDFKILTAADKTEIGEKGINLSGGQKQRVSLARAVYNDADLYLLDDPLSAVDSHVGKHIFNKIIGHHGMLKDKTRVLVTHGIHWLPHVDNIIVVKGGTISESGTYKQLLTHDGAFAQFLKEVLDEKPDETDKEELKMREKIYTRLSSLEESKTADGNELIDLDEVSSEGSSAPQTDDDDESEKEDTSENERRELLAKNKDNKEGQLIDEEDLEYGSVSSGIYTEYVKAVGIKYCGLFIFIFAMLVLCRDFKTIWLGKMTEDPLLANASKSDSDEYSSLPWFYLSVYAFFGIGEIVMSFLLINITFKRTYFAANNIHNNLLLNILKAPMSFFDTTPSGRIITRFSKDMGAVDGLGGCLHGYIHIVGNIISHLAIIIIITPKILVFLCAIFFLYYLMRRVFVATLVQLRRYRSKYSSPILVHFKESLHGVMSIRAYKAQDRFITKMEKTLEKHRKFDVCEMLMCHWFFTKIIFLAEMVSLMVGLIILWDDTISATLASMVYMYSCGLVHNLGHLVYHSTHTEQELVSLERVIEYSDKPKEAEWELPETAPAQEWPKNGEVVLDNYKARYREGLDLVLKGVSCNIRSGEKIGIVGRTGAGKSTMTTALFRLIEAAAGQIDVDGHQIEKLGLHDLRKKITILPQDPVIFGGTLRMNLDPFEERTSEELWEALEHSHLKTFVEGLPDKLDYKCEESGKNLSMGQRQLVCLARTLLRKTKILVLDEATAAVDMETDDLIQKTICKEFRDCTVLTIAHRLNTIIDYDRILVLEEGKVKEFDSPKNLLADTNSVFYGMAKDANLV